MRLTYRGSLLSFLATCLLAYGGTPEETVHGSVFHSDAVGLSYTLPENFSAKVESEMPGPFHDVTGRERFILALWHTSEQSGAPRMTFLYDTKVRDPGLSREEIANRYLAAVRTLWVDVKGAKISGPKRISPAEYAIWRLDMWQPDSLPHFNTAIVIPLVDRRLLAIQVNAPSQDELDAEVNSLRELRFDKK